jgi:hypothetical protein
MADDQVAPIVISRPEAKRRGLKQYFTGKPCTHGHIATRFVSSRKCLACHRVLGAATFARRSAADPAYRARHDEAAAIWKKANPVKNRASLARWRESNLDKARARCRDWHANNPQWWKPYNATLHATNPKRIRDSLALWATLHPEEADATRRASKINRRTRERKNGGKCSGANILSVFERCGGRCIVCGTTERLHLDHILAVKLGGRTEPDNLQLLCFVHNMEKGAKPPDVWLSELAAKGITLLVPLPDVWRDLSAG